VAAIVIASEGKESFRFGIEGSCFLRKDSRWSLAFCRTGHLTSLSF
jgi:hypothetical protein